MESFGLVGLPNAGKSSLYNVVTGGGALAAPYPFATKDPNIGVAKVPDERVDRLGEMSKSKQLVHAAVQVVDIGGLVEGAHKGEGLGNRFLANIREVDAIVYVLRAFPDDDVPRPARPAAPAGPLRSTRSACSRSSWPSATSTAPRSSSTSGAAWPRPATRRCSTRLPRSK